MTTLLLVQIPVQITTILPQRAPQTMITHQHVVEHRDYKGQWAQEHPRATTEEHALKEITATHRLRCQLNWSALHNQFPSAVDRDWSDARVSSPDPALAHSRRGFHINRTTLPFRSTRTMVEITCSHQFKATTKLKRITNLWQRASWQVAVHQPGRQSPPYRTISSAFCVRQSVMGFTETPWNCINQSDCLIHAFFFLFLNANCTKFKTSLFYLLLFRNGPQISLLNNSDLFPTYQLCWIVYIHTHTHPSKMLLFQMSHRLCAYYLSMTARFFFFLSALWIFVTGTYHLYFVLCWQAGWSSTAKRTIRAVDAHHLHFLYLNKNYGAPRFFFNDLTVWTNRTTASCVKGKMKFGMMHIRWIRKPSALQFKVKYRMYFFTLNICKHGGYNSFLKRLWRNSEQVQVSSERDSSSDVQIPYCARCVWRSCQLCLIRSLCTWMLQRSM